MPFLEPILQTLNQAFVRFQAQSLRSLFDAVSSLSDACGDHLNTPQFIELLVPPLMTKLAEFDDDDKAIWAILECLGPVAAALQQGFLPYVPDVFQRCLQIATKFMQETEQAV